MNKALPKPGNGYTIREYLGGGNHKEAYRASSLHQARDVALIYFRTEQPELIAHDIERLIRVRSRKSESDRSPESAYSEYVAQLIAFQTGNDGRSYLVEELLVRPLDKIGPIDDDLIKFVRIARDLFLGLSYLHSINVIHRDLKLDNCGLDSQGRAKIFDLGCLTSDPGDVKGNIFTREPRLFSSADRSADKAADVWALGATIFALRTGNYPFVSAEDVEARRQLNKRLHEGALSPDEAAAAKKEFDERIRAIATKKGAALGIKKTLNEYFRGPALKLMESALDFGVERHEARFFAHEWTEVADALSQGGPIPERRHETKLEQFEKFLQEVAAREVSVTEKQLQRMVDELKIDSSQDNQAGAIKKLVQTIKRRKMFADVRLGALQ